MTAGAIAESEAADALAEATADAATRPTRRSRTARPSRSCASGMPGPVEDPAPAHARRGDRGHGARRCSRGGTARHTQQAGAADVTERVIETLENAVRQRVRAALEAARAPPPRGGHSAGAQRDADAGRQRRSCKWLARRPGRPAAVHRAGWR